MCCRRSRLLPVIPDGPMSGLRSSAILCLVVFGLASCGGDSFAPNAAPPPSPPDPLTLHLEGTVLDVDQQPVSDAEVVLYSESCFFGCSTSAVDSARTGPTGRYSLIVPSACSATLWSGYVQVEHRRGQELQAGKSPVRCWDSVQRLDIQLCRALAISGGGFSCVR